MGVIIRAKPSYLQDVKEPSGSFYAISLGKLLCDFLHVLKIFYAYTSFRPCRKIHISKDKCYAQNEVYV